MIFLRSLRADPQKHVRDAKRDGCNESELHILYGKPRLFAFIASKTIREVRYIEKANAWNKPYNGNEHGGNFESKTLHSDAT